MAMLCAPAGLIAGALIGWFVPSISMTFRVRTTDRFQPAPDPQALPH
jgi:hypothetical protein